MNVSIVNRPIMRAVVLKTNQNGRDVRKAWHELQQLMSNNFSILNEDLGYVFVPEWQWATGVQDFWVGVEVSTFDLIPDGFDTLTIPARTFAMIRCTGNRKAMDDTYNYLTRWFEVHSLERDVQEGSFSFEANRLNPINPFDIPADTIDYFDFDIYAPIKSERL